MNRKLVALISILILVLFGIYMFKYLSSFKQDPQKKTPPQAVRYVKTIPVHYSNLPGIVETSGRLRAFDEVVISSEVSGRLEQGDRMFKAGQYFKKGELIANIINEEFTFQLKAQKSNFLKSIASILPDMKIDFPDSYPIWMDFFESININNPLPKIPETTSSKERIFMATRNILNEYYSIKSNEVRYTKYLIHAPYDGSLKEVTLQVGAVVNPGVRLAVFTRNDLYEVKVPVRVQNINLLKQNVKAELTDESGSIQYGYISRISDVIDPASNTVSVYVAVKDSKSLPLFDGMYLNVKLYGRDVEGVMEMSRNAVYNQTEVYVLKDNKLFKHDINIQKLNDETLYFNGLEPGDMLVIESVPGITGNAKFKALTQ
jgi:multidrug efflux pump subunit AcrA (membrane-fusion protein)